MLTNSNKVKEDSILQTVAGYTFQEILGTNHPEVEHWKALGNKGVAEIFVVPKSWQSRMDAIPKNWSSFCDFDVQPYEGKLAVIVPGILKIDLFGLHRQLGPKSALVFAWHIASSMALLHDTGNAHGMLHPQSIGLDEEGLLSIRPAIIDAIKEDPDPKASAQATDCWQLSEVLEALIGDDRGDDRLRLLLCGLQRDRASIRLQPARAIRQSLVAITSSHPEWEKNLKDQLGDDWGMDTLPPIEHSIIPKLYPQRPRASLPQTIDTTAYNPWSSPFVSTQKDTVVQKQKRISLPSTSLGQESKLRLPVPEKENAVFDEEVDIQEQDNQTIAQIRLPFVSVISNKNTEKTDSEEANLEDLFSEDSEHVSEGDSLEVPPFLAPEVDTVEGKSPQPMAISIMGPPVQQEVVEAQEESSEEWIEKKSESQHEQQEPEPPITETTTDVEEQEVVEAQEESEEAFLPIDTEEIETSVLKVPETQSNIEDQKDVEAQEDLGVPEDREDPKEKTTSVDDKPSKKGVFLMAPEGGSDDEFLDFIDEEALFSEDDSYEMSQESHEPVGALVVETTVVKRELEEVEEIPYEVPTSKPLLSLQVPTEHNVEEFFEDSEDIEEDSYESEEMASISIYEDSVIDDDEKAEVPAADDFDPLGSEEDFLASIFNDREILALENDAKTRLTVHSPASLEAEENHSSATDYPPQISVSSPQETFRHTQEEKTYEEPSIFSNTEEHVAGFESFPEDSFSIDSKTAIDGVFDDEPNGVQPRWMSAKKITADPLREEELGSGKWGHAKSNLDHDILNEVMSSMPTRELELEDDGNSWALMLFGLIGGAVVVLFLYNIVTSL